MWTYHAYRFDSEAAWLAALAAEGWGAGTPPDVALLVSGTLYGPPPDEETPGEAMPGWHVAAAFRDRVPPPSWGLFEIDPPADMPVLWRNPVPQSVSRFQARAALSLSNLLLTVEAFIANSDDVIAKLAWADAVQFERNSPTIAAMAFALGLNNEQIDQLFITASKISA